MQTSKPDEWMADESWNRLFEGNASCDPSGNQIFQKVLSNGRLTIELNRFDRFASIELFFADQAELAIRLELPMCSGVIIVESDLSAKIIFLPPVNQSELIVGGGYITCPVVLTVGKFVQIEFDKNSHCRAIAAL